MTNRFNVKNASDAELLQRFDAVRDERAFEEVVKRHGPMVGATCSSVLDKRHDVEDAVQATFLALANACRKLRDKSAVAGWLQRTAFNSAMQLKRSMARRKERADLMEEQLEMGDSREPAKRITDQETNKIINEEISRLPPNLSVVFVLCCVEGRTVREGAKELELSSSTVGERLSEARRRLQKQLSRRGITLSASGLAALALCGSNSLATKATAAEISRQATLYVAGKSAREIGVSDAVFEIANGVIASMKITQAMTVCFVALAIVFGFGGIAGLVGIGLSDAKAGTLFNEDFSRGLPSGWRELGFEGQRGSAGVTAEGLVLSQNENADSVGLGGLGFGLTDVLSVDTSVQARVRVTESGGTAALDVRLQDPDGDEPIGYVAAIGHYPVFGGTAVFATRVDGNFQAGGEFVSFNTVDGRPFALLPFDIRKEDAVLQIDAIGNEFTAWAWRAGDEMPEQPLFRFTDDTYTEPGFVAVALSNGDPNADAFATGTSQAIFRYVHAADMPIHTIPEPAAASTASLAFFLIAMLLRSRRY